MAAGYDTAVALARAAVFVCALQAAGGSLFLLLHADRASIVDRDVRRLVAVSAAVAALLVMLRSGLEPIRMAGDLRAIVDVSLSKFFWASDAGRAQLVRLGGLALCGTAAFNRGKRFAPHAGSGVVLIMISFALMGHTRTHGAGPWLGLLLILHLTAVAYWLGSLLPLHWVLRRATGEDAVGIIAAFSRRAVWLVSALFLAGVVLAWQLIGSFEALDTPYGLLLLLKIGGFGALLALAAINRYALTPALAAASAQAGPWLRRVILVEIAVMVCVLLTTAVMTTFYSPD